MINNIKQQKQRLRERFRRIRNNITPAQKERWDLKIFERLKLFPPFARASIVYLFVSTPIEVDTHPIIQYCLDQGKKVAVPRCVSTTGRMKFHYIHSLGDLKPGMFSLLEPNPKTAPEAKQFKRSVCIVPCLACDLHGYRLGYGKGYYDRFLSKYSETKILVCYNRCVIPRLPHGRFDIKSDILITETCLKRNR